MAREGSADGHTPAQNGIAECTAAISPEAVKIARAITDAACASDFAVVAATPLLDPFWHTQFTPSTSEVIFRHLRPRLNRPPVPPKLFVLQPCIRAQDLGPTSDGRHLLLFHTATFIWFDHRFTADPGAELKQAFAVLAGLGVDVASSLFTYFEPPSPFIADVPPDTLTDRALAVLEVAPERRIASRGTTVCHASSLRSRDGVLHHGRGPRLEVFDTIRETSSSPLEYATIVLEYCSASDLAESPAVALAIGVERTAAVSHGVHSFWSLPGPSNVIATLVDLLGIGAPCIPRLRQALELLCALTAITNDPQFGSVGTSGAGGQFKRLRTAFARAVQELGWTEPAFLKTVARATGLSEWQQLAETRLRTAAGEETATRRGR